MASETIQLQMLLLTIAALPFATGSRKDILATEPFQPILKMLADLEREAPKFEIPEVRLVGLYRRLWESCVSKHINGEERERQSDPEGDWHTPEKREGRPSASPR